MMMCQKMKGILEEIDSISGLVREDLQLAAALETLALANRVLELGHEIDHREWTIRKTILDAFKQRGGAA